MNDLQNFDESARELLDKVAGPENVMELEPDLFKAHKQEIYFGNLRQTWETVPEEKRLDWLESVLHSLVFPPKSPDELESFEQLRVGLRSRAMIESATFRFKGFDNSVPYTQIGDDLAAVLLLDHPDTVSFMNNGMLKRWDKTLTELTEEGLNNLPPSQAWSSFDSLVWSPHAEDDYLGARILTPTFYNFLKSEGIDGDVVITHPNRSSLFVAPADNPAAIELLCRLTSDARATRRTSNCIPIVGTLGDWRNLRLEPSHTAFHVWRELVIDEKSIEYGEQKANIEALQEEQPVEHPYFVASYLTGSRNDDTKKSVAIWSPVEAILPKAEMILLKQDTGHDVISDWETVAGHAGSLMTKTSMYPERWHVRSLPAPEIIERIAKDSREG